MPNAHSKPVRAIPASTHLGKAPQWARECYSHVFWAFWHLLTWTAAVRWLHQSPGAVVAGDGSQPHALATLLGHSLGWHSQLQLGCSPLDNAVRPISMGLGGEHLAGARLCFNLRINFCVLAFVSLSASPCSKHRNLRVSSTSAALDNNTSYYLYLHEFNTSEPRQSEC